MKKILVAGGAGTMGAEVVRQILMRSDAVVTVADANANGLGKIQVEHGGKVQTTQINISDKQALVNLMRNHDVTISTVGPFYKFGIPVLKAAIDAGAKFIDINDDYDATQRALQLDGEAKQKGATAVIGMGASPGISNLVAKCGASKLDKTDEIRLYWSESGIDPTGAAAMFHWFHITTGSIPVYKDGQWINVLGLSEPEKVTFVDPIGTLDVAYTGHPEPVTLPLYIPGVKHVGIKGAIFPPKMMQLYKLLTQAGFGSIKDFAIGEDLHIPMRELSVKIIRAMPHFAPDFFADILKEANVTFKNSAGATKIVVSGRKNDRAIQYIYDVTSYSVKKCTAAPAAIAALMILDGKIDMKGVFAPEGVFEIGDYDTKMNNIIKIEETESNGYI